MSQISSTVFSPRFVVLDEKNVATKAATTSATESASQPSARIESETHKFWLEQLSEAITKHENVDINIICFEEVNENSDMEQMLTNLVKAIAKKSYSLYQLPLKLSRPDFLLEIYGQLNKQEAPSAKDFLVFLPLNTEATQVKVLSANQGGFITTYGLKELSLDQAKKKDLWLKLKNHFS